MIAVMGSLPNGNQEILEHLPEPFVAGSVAALPSARRPTPPTAGRLALFDGVMEVKKMEKVLADFWRDAPDLKLRDGLALSAYVNASGHAGA